MQLIQTFKPAASRRTRLLLAALIWSCVGVGLFSAGVRFLALSTSWLLWAAAVPSIGVGILKGRYILGRRARANAARIEATDDRRCIGGMFSAAMWALVLMMVTVGTLMRASPLPRPWLGIVYVAVGSALMVGSLVSWSHWRRLGESGR